MSIIVGWRVLMQVMKPSFRHARTFFSASYVNITAFLRKRQELKCFQRERDGCGSEHIHIDKISSLLQADLAEY